MSEEKSVAAELKDILDVAVAAKADKSDLEGMVKTADLEGVVKSEQLEEMKAAHAVELETAKSEMREEMEAKFAAVPALQEVKAMVPVSGFTSQVTETGETVNRKTLSLTKAAPIGSAESTIPGSVVGVNPLYQEMEIANPFRAFSTIMPVSVNSFKLPDFNGAIFVSDGGSVADPFAHTNRSQLQSRTESTERWVSTTQIARPTLDDIDNLRGFVQQSIVNAYGKAQGFDALAAITAGVNVTALGTELVPVAIGNEVANIRSVAQRAINVKEETLAAITDGTMIFDVLDALIQNTNVAYRPGGVFHMSSSMASTIQRATSGTASGFEFDPVERVNRLWGYAVNINDYIPAPAEDAICAYFGTMSRSLVLAEQQNLVVDEYDQTLPGYNTYYATGRFKNVLWDYAGMSALRANT